jgi:glycosyltransferase involved in cell wall biosynthesis
MAKKGFVMSLPFVSVVIPTYNYGRFVTDAVESVLAQTYRDFEIIVVDDGSSDDTQTKLEAYLDRIISIRQENQGCSAARNAGIKAAKGDWVAFMDADDLWHPRKLEIQMAYLARHPDVSMVASDHSQGFHLGWLEIPSDSEVPAERIGLEDIAVRSRFGPSGVIVRKECFDKVGVFDPDLRSVEDREMWMRIACHYHIENLKLPLWWYRIHGASMCYVVSRMISFERKVLERTFAMHPLLKKKWRTRLKAFSYYHRSAAYMYSTAGMHIQALAQVLWSLAVWPLPYPKRDSLTPMERPKMLIVMLLRMLRLKQPGTAPL